MKRENMLIMSSLKRDEIKNIFKVEVVFAKNQTNSISLSDKFVYDNGSASYVVLITIWWDSRTKWIMN